jgi:hypothetical protein
MVGSGWQIYNASPLFALVFPASVTLGGWLAAGLLWHLAAMWLLIGNGVVYVTWGLATGRFRKKLLPIRPGEVVRDVGAALSGRLSHNDLTHYNAVQKLLYAGILLAGAVIVASGFAIWKPDAAAGACSIVWRLRGRAAGALLCHDHHRCLPGGACCYGIAGTKVPARHDSRPLKEIAMRQSKRRAHDVDPGLLVKDAAKLLPNSSRRLFLYNVTSLGALALLTGCDIIDGPSSEKALSVGSQFNDWVQARLFNQRSCRTYSVSAITRPFPFNTTIPRASLDVDGTVQARHRWPSRA